MGSVSESSHQGTSARKEIILVNCMFKKGGGSAHSTYLNYLAS